MMMKPLIAGGAALLAGLMLASCQTLNEAECQTVGWTELGQRDAEQGRDASYVERHIEACAGHGLPVDAAAWRAGWDVGVRNYCIADRALDAGRSGISYNTDMCAGPLSAEITRAYDVGRRLYEAERDRRQVESDIDSLSFELADAQDPDQRAILRAQLALKESELHRADRRLREAEWEMDRYLALRRYAG